MTKMTIPGLRESAIQLVSCSAGQIRTTLAKNPIQKGGHLDFVFTMKNLSSKQVLEYYFCFMIVFLLSSLLVNYNDLVIWPTVGFSLVRFVNVFFGPTIFLTGHGLFAQDPKQSPIRFLLRSQGFFILYVLCNIALMFHNSRVIYGVSLVFGLPIVMLILHYRFEFFVQVSVFWYLVLTVLIFISSLTLEVTYIYFKDGNPLAIPLLSSLYENIFLVLISRMYRHRTIERLSATIILVRERQGARSTEDKIKYLGNYGQLTLLYYASAQAGTNYETFRFLSFFKIANTAYEGGSIGNLALSMVCNVLCVSSVDSSLQPYLRSLISSACAIPICKDSMTMTDEEYLDVRKYKLLYAAVQRASQNGLVFHYLIWLLIDEQVEGVYGYQIWRKYAFSTACYLFMQVAKELTSILIDFSLKNIDFPGKHERLKISKVFAGMEAVNPVLKYAAFGIYPTLFYLCVERTC